jgi:hypothetical protein
MIPPLQWDELHMKVWSWLRDELLKGHVQFEVECDLVRYENKAETIEEIHKLNLLGETFQKAFKNHHKMTTC